MLLAPLAAWQAAPAAGIPVCSVDGGVRHVPDPLAPAQPLHAHCEACLVVPPALPVAAMAPQPPLSYRIALWLGNANRPAPATLPPRQARAPPPA
jgi:hypothetical protein